MLTNVAAWITAPHARLSIGPTPYPTPAPGEVIIRTSFVAINPLEYKIQDHDPPIAGKPIVYPTILGADVSGTIVELGADVTIRQIGDRVIANADGVSTSSARSAFQHYVQLRATDTTFLPAHVPLEAGVVLPLACDTTAAGLFVPDQLGLSTFNLSASGPPISTTTTPIANATLLIWGGSSSVACCAIQMARAAGYSVFTTSSARNHALCETMGAVRVFDYSDPGVEDAIVLACRDRRVVGALDCIGDCEGSLLPCARILARVLKLEQEEGQERDEKEEERGRECGGGSGSVGRISTVLAPPPDVVLPRGVTATRRKCRLFCVLPGFCFRLIALKSSLSCSAHSRSTS